MVPRVLRLALAVALLSSPGASAAVVFNELLCDTCCDANGDGETIGWEDTFIELLNTGPATADISDYRIGLERFPFDFMFAFPDPTTLLVNEMLLLFGGETPTGFGGQVIVLPTDDDTAPTWAGDNVWIITPDQSETTEVYWGNATPISTDAELITTSNCAQGQSYTRDPDAGSTWAKHSVADTADNSIYSPGARISGEENLPVGLVELRATGGVGTVTVEWATATEVDLDHFAVGRALRADLADARTLSLVPASPGGHSVHRREYAFEDTDPPPGRDLMYIVWAVDHDGTRAEFGPVRARAEDAPVPRRLRVGNHPNPFNPRTVITVDLEEARWVDIGVYDTGGRRVRTVCRGPVPAGPHAWIWDGRTDRGDPVGSGVYWCRADAGGQASTHAMVLLE